jgi:hypothetical protein
MLAVENLLGAEHDLWSVNVEADYHEDGHHEDGHHEDGHHEDGHHEDGHHEDGHRWRDRAAGRPTTGGTGRSAPVLPRRQHQAGVR